MSDTEKIQNLTRYIEKIENSKFNLILQGFLGGFTTAIFSLWFIYTCLINR